jgi:hypothetical protein
MTATPDDEPGQSKGHPHPRHSIPGLRSTGFGVIDTSAAATLCRQRLHQDRRRGQPAGTHQDHPRWLAEIIATYQPQQAAVEIVFVNVNPQSTLLLGQARGAAIAALVTATCRSPNTPPAGQAGRGRPRQGGQGAGAGHGRAPAQALPGMPSRRTPPTPWPAPLPTPTAGKAWARWLPWASGCAAGGIV